MPAGPVVSVVTPVYNGERYLDECIQSVLTQTFPHWDYVIVDNASTDNTAAIAERYAREDRRIRVVRSSEFLPIYGNHNRALAYIDPQSRYCKLIHADDWLYPECLERMVDVAEHHPNVGVVTAYRLSDKDVQNDNLFAYSQTTIHGKEVIKLSLQNRVWKDYVVGSPTSVLLRTQVVRSINPFYDESFWHADSEAAYQSLLVSDLGFVPQVLTFTRLHPGALTMFSYRVWSFIAEEGRLLMRFGPEVLDAADYQMALRRWLRDYGIWILKQSLKPWRHGQAEFHDFHKRQIEHMIAETNDHRTRLILRLYRHMLHVRRSDHGISSRGSSSTPWTSQASRVHPGTSRLRLDEVAMERQ